MEMLPECYPNIFFRNLTTTMSIPQNKYELLQSITDNYQKLNKEIAGIPPGLTKKKELEGHAKGSLMSVHDLVAYLVGWGQLVLKWYDRKSRGLEVDFPETGFKWNELGLLAQKFYRDYANRDFKTLVAELDQTTGDIITLIESTTNEALYETDWYREWTLGRLIQLNTAAPFRNATARIRKWKKSVKA